MKKLLNTLYVTTPMSYLSLEGETVVVKNEDGRAMQVPLLNVENIICFGSIGASPAVMGACAAQNIGLIFLTRSGRFLARITGKVNGNVLLRKKQYLLSDRQDDCVRLGRWFLTGKIYNARKVIDRGIRDHAAIIDVQALTRVSTALLENLKTMHSCTNENDLMGCEGNAARGYFSVLDELILQQKECFYIKERSRRPPLDNFNALLSFFYTILTHEIASALESVGLDPCVGFLHKDKPGRPSLALDIIEELRPVLVDRFVLSMVNLKQVSGNGFIQKESGGVVMDDETRRKVITLWQKRKNDEIIHPFLKEHVKFGLIPYIQALLLARYLRGDMDAYPPFFWS